MFKRTQSRRYAISASLAAATAGLVAARTTWASLRPKSRGETKVVYLGGDQLHNGYGQEYYLRKTFKQVDWRFMFATDARYVTPSLIEDADLLMIARWLGPIPGWLPEPVVETREELDGFMTDELADAIVENVTARGMGFISLHAAVTCAGKPQLRKLMGVNARAHGPFQNVRIHDLNPDHPITTDIRQWKQIDGKGLWDRELTAGLVTSYTLLDENFGALPEDNAVTVLMRSTGEQDKREDIAGWCVERGNGRVVGLCAGHSSDQFIDPSNRQIQFRAAHWAMKRDIPAYEGALDHR